MSASNDYFGFYTRIQELMRQQLDRRLPQDSALDEPGVLNAVRASVQILRDEGWFDALDYAARFTARSAPPDAENEHEIDDDLLVESLAQAGYSLDATLADDARAAQAGDAAATSFDKDWALTGEVKKAGTSAERDDPDIPEELAEQRMMENAARWFEKDQYNREGLDDIDGDDLDL